MKQTNVHSLEEYNKQREKLLQGAHDLKYGDLKFTEDELKANEIFNGLRDAVKPKLDEKFHFEPIKYRDIVEPSPLYKFLLDMPKGSQQHSHNPCSVKSSWFVKHTYASNVYIDETGKIDLFDQDVPANYKSVQKLREEASDKAVFDKAFADNFHLIAEDYEKGNAWTRFEFKIANRLTIACQEGVWEECVLETFLYAIEEGYSNLQVRMFIPFWEHKIFMDPEAEVALYRRCLAKAQEKDPNFTIGIIFAGLRFWDNEKVKKFVDLTYELRKKHSDIVIAFDLVAEEQLRAAKDFAPVFVELFKKEDEEGHNLPLMLHGGESIDSTNTNLYDLMVCNVTRIGHGLNLFKHAYLMPMIKERGIAIEVNPISNQMLRYTHDLRVHPAIGYHSFGLKVTLNSDDIEVFNLQTIWDFYMAAMSFEFNLLDLKKVISNSIETAGLNKDLQEVLANDWNTKWDAFIGKVVKGQYSI